MSHELRTPLNSLLILAEQLKDNPENNMTDTQVQYANVISTSGKELIGLLNSISTWPRSNRGPWKPNWLGSPWRSSALPCSASSSWWPKERASQYTIDLVDGCPETIVTDAQRLRQILKNLLSNAFKFTEHGDVRIEVRSAVRGRGGNQPLPPTHRRPSPSRSATPASASTTSSSSGSSRPSPRATAPTARLYGGTGLGLSISRELAGLLGGGITLTSRPGRGSTFTVSLPVNGPVAAHPEPLAADVAASVLALAPRPPGEWDQSRRQSDSLGGDFIGGRKILVVDDDFRNIFALTAVLERGHAEVFTAESGSEALATLERVPGIDIVLMDIMMPVMDGYATIRAIRERESFKHLPIIAVTGKVMAGERERCLAAGASDYVPKPIDTGELLTALQLWLPVVAPPLAPVETSPPAGPVPGLPPVSPLHVPDGPAKNSDAKPAEHPEPLVTGAGTGPTILVVDDDFRNTFALSALLERGHRVIVAENGAQALTELDRVPDIDVVLMDIMMPVMDGYATMRVIRDIEQFEKIPIIAVTSKVMPGERQRCIDAGASDYVPKPIDSAELFAALRPWLPTTVQPTAA